jgi:hypothetical protein
MGQGDYNLKKRLAREAAAAEKALKKRAKRGPYNVALSETPNAVYQRLHRLGLPAEEVASAVRLAKARQNSASSAAEDAVLALPTQNTVAQQIIRSTAMLDATIRAAEPLNIADALLTKEQELAARRLQADAEEQYRQTLRIAAKNSLWVMLTEVVFHPSIECNGSTTPPSEGIEGCCYKKSVFYEPLHKEWCEYVQDLTKKRRGILAPRGHFKSSVVTLAFAVWLLITHPNWRILVVSAVEKNAINFAGVAKDAFHRNPRMRWLFPEACPPVDARFGTEQEFTIPSRTDITITAPSLTSAHLDASLASQHFDVILFDDPIERKHVATEEQASKARASFNKVLPLLDPGGIIRILGTRYAHYDLYSVMVPESQGGTATSTPYEWIVRAAFEKDGKPDFESGDPIFPTRFSRAILLDMLEAMRLDPELGETFWWQQYMNICRAPGTEPFLEEWFLEIDPPQAPPVLFGKMICIDTALKDDAAKRGGDHTVMLAGGWDAQGRLYIFSDATRSQTLRSKEFLDILVSMARTYGIVTIVKQKVSEDTLGTSIRDAFNAVHLPLDYRPITINAMGRKEIRIKDALQGPFQRQEIFFVRRRNKDGSYSPNPIILQIKKELVNLGQYSSDDAADALANFFHPDVKVRKQNVVGDVGGWRVPGSPMVQQSNHEGAALWKVAKGNITGWDGVPN